MKQTKESEVKSVKTRGRKYDSRKMWMDGRTDDVAGWAKKENRHPLIDPVHPVPRKSIHEIVECRVGGSRKLGTSSMISLWHGQGLCVHISLNMVFYYNHYKVNVIKLLIPVTCESQRRSIQIRLDCLNTTTFVYTYTRTQMCNNLQLQVCAYDNVYLRPYIKGL